MRKPVNVWVVVMCLLLIVALASTLIIPMFAIRMNPIGIEGEYVQVSGMDMINALFGNGSDYLTQTTAVQKLYDFLGKGVTDLTQYINPVFANIMLWAYVITLGLSAVMFVFTIFNFAGIRLSVFNVFAGLITFVCGIILCLGVVLQNQEYVSNIVIEYDLRLSVGAIMTLVIGFVYMMLAPKKRP